jgi:hypothetical protein
MGKIIPVGYIGFKCCSDENLRRIFFASYLDTALPKLFAHLVEVNEQEVATRRRAPQSFLQDDVKTVADALIEARLLVSGEGEDQQPMIEVAHETFLSGWERLRLWILDQAGALRARRDLEQAASEWHKTGRPGSALRTGILLQRYVNAAPLRNSGCLPEGLQTAPNSFMHGLLRTGPVVYHYTRHPVPR